jgi:O-antigen/teichoic acid export membrane protein
LEEPAPDFNFAKKLFSFSLSVYGLWFLSLIVFDKSEMFFLRAFRAPEELAFYSIAFALGARLATVGDSISEVLFPMFVTRYAQSGAAGLRGLCNRSLRYYCLFILPLYLWCVPLTPRLLNFFYGERYAAVAPVFQIMLITLLFSALLPIGSSALFALDKQFSFLRYLVLVAAINLIFDFLLIPRYGAVGAALANGAAQALAACAQARVLHKALPGGFPFVVLLKIYLAGTVSVIPLVYCARMPHASFLLLSASAVLALLLYIALLVALRAIQFDQLAVAKTNLHSFVSRKA